MAAADSIVSRSWPAEAPSSVSSAARVSVASRPCSSAAEAIAMLVSSSCRAIDSIDFLNASCPVVRSCSTANSRRAASAIESAWDESA